MTVKTVHDRGDAVITRYQANLDSGDFGIAVDLRTQLLYVTQRFGNNIAVFDRRRERFIDVIPIPTPVSGAHTCRFDLPTNSVWIAAGEGSKILRLVLHPRTLRPHNFVEYTPPGIRPIVKPHSLVIAGGREVWYTDDRQERVGVLNIRTGHIHVLDRHIEADGIMLEERGRPAGSRPPSPQRPPAFTGRAASSARRSTWRPPIQRLWVAGGKTLTVIDAHTRRIAHEIHMEREIGISQLRLHDLGFYRPKKRVYVLMRGGDRVAIVDADRPGAGPIGYVPPAQGAAGLDHLDIGRYVWWTEGLQNNLTRHDPYTGRTRGYDVPVPGGYFNPHGVTVVRPWREVWFTEREGICKLRFKDGRSP